MAEFSVAVWLGVVARSDVNFYQFVLEAFVKFTLGIL